MAPGLVTASDIMMFGLDGEALGDDRRTAYVERYIHSEIYKAQPEVVAVVHSHSPAVIPFSVTAAKLRPIYHMSSFLGSDVPVFEIRDTHGDQTDMLIRSPALGAALALSLGQATVALMRGHGNVVVGRSIPEVVFRAIYTEMNARLQTEALRLGEGRVTYLSDGEAAASLATNAGVLTRAWELWKAAAMGNGG
jgi:ribulose-5-phosphate 4-epimerase/fuculose-1-phosphate aldolase